MADIEVTLGSPLHLAYLEQAATQRTYRSVIDRLGPAPWSVLGFQGWMKMVSRFTTTMKQPQGKGSGGGGVIGLDRAVYSTASIPELFVELINEENLSDNKRCFFAPDVVACDGLFTIIRRRKAATYVPDGMHDVASFTWQRSLVRRLLRQLMEMYFKQSVDYSVLEGVAGDGSLVFQVNLQEVIYKGDRYFGHLGDHSMLLGDGEDDVKVSGRFQYGRELSPVVGRMMIVKTNAREGMLSVEATDNHGKKKYIKAIVRFDEAGIAVNFAPGRLGHDIAYKKTMPQWLAQKPPIDHWTNLVNDSFLAISGHRQIQKYTEHKLDGVGVATGIQFVGAAMLAGKEVPQDVAVLMKSILDTEEVRDRIFLAVLDGVIYYLVSEDPVLIKALYAKLAA